MVEFFLGSENTCIVIKYNKNSGKNHGKIFPSKHSRLVHWQSGLNSID